MKLFILLLLTVICSCSESKNEVKNVTVASTNYPVKWLVDYISGETVENSYIIPADIDPAYWEPTDEELQKLNASDQIFLNGATYEKWLNTASLANTFDTSQSIKDRFLSIKDEMEHEHNGKKHSHDGIDFNIWLNFDLFIKQAEAVEQKLSELIKEPKVDFKANLKSLVSEINQINKDISEAAKDQKSFLASHPVYDYLGQQQGWSIKSFHWEPEQMPNDEEWQKLTEAKKHSRYMLWEDMPNDEIRKKLIELDITVIVFRTCGNTPPSGDLIKEMKQNIENLKRVFTK